MTRRSRGRWRTGPMFAWHAVDLTDAAAVTRLFTRLREDGGATALVHLAAHYDFTGERHPDYQRTNVEGTRRLLDACDGLGLERFVFASSLAACEFPRAGRILVESSPPDGAHVYAESKRAGEAIVRGGAALSDHHRALRRPLFGLVRVRPALLAAANLAVEGLELAHSRRTRALGRALSPRPRCGRLPRAAARSAPRARTGGGPHREPEPGDLARRPLPRRDRLRPRQAAAPDLHAAADRDAGLALPRSGRQGLR